jgi:hypothetical protein
MKLRERYNTEFSLRAAKERRNADVRTFAQPHNVKPEFIGMWITNTPTGTPVTGKQDQHS